MDKSKLLKRLDDAWAAALFRHPWRHRRFQSEDVRLGALWHRPVKRLDSGIWFAYTQYMTDEHALGKWEGFEWDEGNLLKNWEKRRVSALECEQVFFNRPLVAGLDESHSTTEARYHALGVTDAGRRLFIVFTIRNNRIRVISAREMNRRERKVFDES